MTGFRSFPRRFTPPGRFGVAGALVVAAVLLATVRPQVQESQTVRAVAFGDFGKAGPGEVEVSQFVKTLNPDVILALGDNNYELGEASTIDANIGQYYHEFIAPYYGTYGAGGTVNRFFAALGNHDWGDGFRQPATVQAHIDYFTLPGNERYYDFVRGPVHFFAIDSDYHEPDGNTATSVQAAWLQAALAASTSPWKIVYFHHPPYTSGPRPADTYMRWPFREWGATAVLAAHHHAYEFIMVENVPYYVSGLGGHGTNSFSFPIPGSRSRYAASYGVMQIVGTPSQLTLQFLTTAGSLIDSHVIDAPVGPDAPNQLVATAVPTGRIDLFWRDNASSEIGQRVERSTDGVSFSEIAVVDPDVTTYTDDSVSVEPTPYHYRVAAILPGGSTNHSNIASATTVPSPPDPPTLTASPASTSSVQLNWDATGLPARVYRLVTSRYENIGTVAAPGSSFLDTTRTPGMTYTYVVRTFNEGGESASSNEATVTLDVLGTPTGVTATAVSASQIDVTWVDNSNGENYFKIWRSTDGANFSVYAWVPANGTSFSDTGRPPLTTYHYRVQAYEFGGGVSALSGIGSATTLAPLAAPSNLTAAPASNTSINLAWHDNSTTETSFQLYRSTDGVNFSLLTSLAANTTSFVNTGLSPSTFYAYRITAKEASGTESAPSNTASATTPSASAPPNAPTALTATPTATTKIALEWADNSANEQGFHIERSTNGSAFAVLVSVGANVTSYNNTSLKEGTAYSYRVLSYNGQGVSTPSNTATATTPGSLASPTSLVAVAEHARRVRLTWQDATTTESGFKVYRSSDSQTFTFLGTVGANVTTYVNNSPEPATPYWYYVIAYAAGTAQSAPSNVAAVVTPSVPSPPTNLAASAPSTTQIVLTWTDTSSDETHFRVERSTNGVSWSTIAWPSANSTSYTDNGRSPGTTYHYRVGSYNGNGTSEFSNVATATTPGS